MKTEKGLQRKRWSASEHQQEQFLVHSLGQWYYMDWICVTLMEGKDVHGKKNKQTTTTKEGEEKSMKTTTSSSPAKIRFSKLLA
jgi:hypothetical protein